jgi:hypothetical protein
MVTSRKPLKKRTGERRGETLEQMFQRLLQDESGRRLRLTLEEARYLGRRIWETGDAGTPTGEEVMRDFYGDWSEDEASEG